MSRGVRFSTWCLCVFGTLLSPVLFRFVAPWAGAAWQCACVGGILGLYATTPADAIRLPRWVSKAVIVGGMAALPALCYGRVTWAVVVVPVVVFVFDHVALTFFRPEGRKGVHIAARWSWAPGVAGDWLATILLWSPIMWTWLAGRATAQNPASAVMGTALAMVWMFALQFADRGPTAAGLRQRVVMACVFLVVGLGAIAGYAMSPDV